LRAVTAAGNHKNYRKNSYEPRGPSKGNHHHEEHHEERKTYSIGLW
jgi:hypothetical protein